VGQHGDDGAVDAAAEGVDGLAVADLAGDLGDRVVDELLAIPGIVSSLSRRWRVGL
jgi:hypothetical protein